MKNIIQKIVLMAVMFSLSVLSYAVPENNSILRLESKNSAGEVVYAVADKNEGNAISAKTDAELANYGLEYALWIAEVSGNTFKLKNLGTEKYLSNSQRNGSGWFGALTPIVYLSTNTSGVSISDGGDNGYSITHNRNTLYIQYDPNNDEWRYYAKNGTNKDNSQSSGNWSDTTNPPSNEETSMEIPGTIVNQMFGGGDLNEDNIEKIKDAVASGDLMEMLEKDPVSIVVGDDTTYPEATSGFWKTATIKLNVTYEDWTPVSFPVDVKCISDLSGVGYQEYSTDKRANGESAWVTNYVTSDMVFKRGVAYNFATDNAVMTLEFKSIAETTLTTIEKNHGRNLGKTSGAKEENQNWYYIGNALFVEAGVTSVEHGCMYNKGTKKYDEFELNNRFFDPFATLFVQYAGDYSVVASAASTQSSAPRLAREKSETEKYYLRIEGEGDDDQTGIFFEEEASAEGYVIGEDFLSFATKGRSFTEIYTYEEDIEFAFNTRPMENTFVKVGLYVGKAGRYTISLDNVSGNAESMILYDTYEQDFARLHLGEIYTFDSERGSFDDRFAVAVTYAPSTTTDNISLSAMNMVVVNNEIQGLEVGADYAIYDSTGRMVYSSKADAETVVLPDLNTGVYIVRTATGWVKFVVK